MTVGMRWHSLLWALLFGALSTLPLLACGPPEGCGGGCPADAGSMDADKAKDAAQFDVYDEPTPVCHVSGTATDSQDAPWPLARLQICSTALCTLGNAAADGTFSVGVPCDAYYHVLAQPPVGDPHNTSDGIGVLANIVTADVTLPTPVRIPETGTPVALTGGSQTVSVATSLELTTDPSDLTFLGPAELAGVLIDQAKWPPFAFPSDAGAEAVLAMWALLPFGTDATASNTIAITVDNTPFGLATNATVSFYQVNETTAQLMPNPSTGTVQAGGTITGGTVTRVTWIVMTSP